ncbi:MAG: choice-of-anchor D domain-containing protein [Archangium sp.]|nr:choice-of-anchor D domain-containing protein [Archangium sp.]
MKTPILLPCFLLLAGCQPVFTGAPCETTDNCPGGQSCVEGKCVASDGGGGSGGGGGTGGGDVGGGSGGGGGGGGVGGGGGSLGGGSGGGGGTVDDGGLDGGTDDAGVIETDGGLGAAPATHDFGDVATGAVSSTFTFTITNSSTSASGTLSVMLGGANASAFGIATNTCTGTLGAGGSCDVGIAFAPTMLGAATASLDVSGNPGGAISLGLTGNGSLPATLELSPMTQAFGSVVAGSSSAMQTFTLRNVGGTPSGVVSVTPSGANASDFILTNGCTGALAPMSQCTFSLVFAPSAAGSKTATVTAQATPGGAPTASLSGTGLSPPALAGLPTPGVFASTVQGQDSAPVAFTITNSGGATSPALTTTLAGTNAGDFLISSDTCDTATVAAMGTCVVTLRFHPLGTGSRNGTLTVSGTGLVPVVIPLGGTGLTPASLSLSPMGTVNFGDVATGATQTVAFGVTNVGQGTSGPVSVTPMGADFSLMSTTCSGALAGGASCDFVVRFQPATVGAKSGSVQVQAAPGGTQSASFVGNGVTPGALRVAPASLDFGDVVQGQTSPAQSFTVSNTGSSATTVPTVTIGGAGQGFAQTHNCTTALGPGATCTINVTFTPGTTTRGQQSAFVQVSATTGGVASGSVTGNAQAPASLSISPGSASFSPTTVGSTGGTSVSVTITNNGDQTSGALNAMISTSDFVVLPQAGDCRNLALPGLTSCALRLAFTPQAAGARSANLSVTGTPGGNVVAMLTGTGLTPANLTLTPVSTSSFGNVIIPGTASRVFVVGNSGQSTSGPLAFSLPGTDFQNVTPGAAGDCAVGNTLAPGGSCNLTIRFTASLPQGNKSALLTATATPGGSPSLTLTGVSQRPALLTPATSSHGFGGVEVGTSAPSYDWTLTNAGDVPTATLTTTRPAEYTVASDTCNNQVLAPLGTCTVRFAFLPPAAGAFNRTLTVSGTGVSATITVTGVGMWRLTVTPSTTTGWVDTTDGQIRGCTQATPTQCSALYANGARPALRARTSNGSGIHFARWSAPAECTPLTMGAACTLLPMNASVTAVPNFSTFGNLAFVTSGVIPANLGFTGTPNPYDALCNVHASDAGINNSGGTGYVAWVSTVTNRAVDRLTATGGQRRPDGNVFATSKAQMLANSIRYPISLDETGRQIPGVGDNIWTGANSTGGATMSDCVNWTSNTVAVNRGIPTGGPSFWSDIGGSHFCSNGNTRVLCLGNMSNTSLGTSIPFGNKRIFRTTPVPMPSGLSGANNSCSAQASAAGIGTNYRALLASTGASAATNALLSDTTTYQRVDGTRIGTGAEIKVKNLTSGIWQNANGTFIIPSSGGELAWTGAPDPNTAGVNSETCLNWTSSSGFTRVGRTQSSSGNFFDVNGNMNPCTGSFGLYCVEQ